MRVLCVLRIPQFGGVGRGGPGRAPSLHADPRRGAPATGRPPCVRTPRVPKTPRSIATGSLRSGVGGRDGRDAPHCGDPARGHGLCASPRGPIATGPLSAPPPPTGRTPTARRKTPARPSRRESCEKNLQCFCVSVSARWGHNRTVQVGHGQRPTGRSPPPVAPRRPPYIPRGRVNAAQSPVQRVRRDAPGAIPPSPGLWGGADAGRTGKGACAQARPRRSRGPIPSSSQSALASYALQKLRRNRRPTLPPER